ncbi:MAG: hypothetical protein WBF17_19590 [Phycisphaerae bacterium]
MDLTARDYPQDRQPETPAPENPFGQPTGNQGLAGLFGGKPQASGVGPQPAGLEFHEYEVLHRASTAANGETFNRLWHGNLSGYTSPQQAAVALCAILAFWVNRDFARIDRLFRHSALFGEWWDKYDPFMGQTAGAIAVHKALSLTHNSPSFDWR